MNIKNKFLLGICIIFLISIINSCGMNGKGKDIHDNSEKNEAYKDNEKIAQKSEDYTFIERTNNGLESNDKIDWKYNGFSGICTIWILNVKEDSEITLNYDSVVNGGDCKLVLAKTEKDIENMLEGTGKGNKTIKLIKGEYRIKIVGKDAKGEISFSISENNSVDVKKAE